MIEDYSDEYVRISKDRYNELLEYEKQIKKHTNNQTELFVLTNNSGQFMRAKGYSGHGKSWVDGIKTAKIYTSIGPAKAQVTYWKKHFPEYECPKIVVLEATIKKVLDQSDRVDHVIEKQKRDKINSEKKALQNKISSLTNKLNKLKTYG